jgi:chemotaxis response regulator CheB
MARSLPLNAYPTKRSVVVIIGSAGAISALIELLALLPPTFPFPVIIAQHLPPQSPSMLPTLLAWRAQLPVKWAEQEEVPLEGRVYLVPPGCQLEVGTNGFAISALPPFSRSWLCCPDLLLTSAVACYGEGVVGIVLSGTLATGIAGLRAIREGGGITMAQNKSSSLFFDMPAGAIDQGKAELVLSPARIAEALILIAEQWEESAYIADRPGGS